MLDNVYLYPSPVCLLSIFNQKNEAGWSLFRDRGVDVTEIVFNPPEWGADPTPQVNELAK